MRLWRCWSTKVRALHCPLGMVMVHFLGRLGYFLGRIGTGRVHKVSHVWSGQAGHGHCDEALLPCQRRMPLAPDHVRHCPVAAFAAAGPLLERLTYEDGLVTVVCHNLPAWKECAGQSSVKVVGDLLAAASRVAVLAEFDVLFLQAAPDSLLLFSFAAEGVLALVACTGNGHGQSD